MNYEKDTLFYAEPLKFEPVSCLPKSAT